MVAVQAEPHTLVQAVLELHAALDHMPSEAWAGLEPSMVRRLVADLSRAESRLQAQKVRAAQRLESTGEARRAGATSTGDLLARDFGGDRRSGDHLVRVARQVPQQSATQREMEAALVTFAQAGVIGRSLETVPEAKRELAEPSLLADAKKLNLKDLRRRADRVSDAWAEPAEVDRTENQTLAERERRARAAATFRLWDNKNGTFSGDFTIPEHAADMLKQAVDALSAPRRDHLADRGAAPTDSTHRAGMGFADLCTHLPTDGLPAAGGLGAVMTVNLDYDTLTEGTKAATLATGTRMSAAEARKTACRIGLIPQVLGAESVPLDLGRQQRLFNHHQRRALAHRDGGCAFPSCDRPPSWTEAHHLTPWSRGGQTNLDDGVLLCPFHHHVVHDQDWELRRSPDDGVIEFRKDETRWRRNHRFRVP